MELKRVSALTGRSNVTKKDLEEFGRVSYVTVYKHFGSLRRALEKAELQPSRYMKSTEEELLNILIELWEKTIESEGRRPQRKDLKIYGYAISSDTFVRRYGSWKKALMKAVNQIQEASYAEQQANVGRDIEKVDKRKSISLRKRFFIMKRDSFTCKSCGANGYGVRLEVDHIVPVAKGGNDSLDNLQTLCFECNRGKRDTLAR